MLQLLTQRRTTHRRRRRDEPAPRVHPGLVLLIERGLIENEVADRVLEEARAAREPVPVALERQGLVTGHDWARLIAERYGLEQAPRSELPRSPVMGETFQPRFLRQAWVLPLQVTEERLWLGMADPADEAALKAVRLAAAREVVPVVVAVEDLRDAFERLFESGRAAIQQIVDDITPEGVGAADQDVEELIDLAREAPVVRLVNQLLADALRLAASDIHIEPFGDRLQVRFRVHGRLREIGSPPVRLSAAVISRIKILAGLDVAERRLPQDGRTRMMLQGRRIDLRVATMPSMHGETLVIRLLDSSRGDVSLPELGLDAANEALLRQQLQAPYGMLLVTGPTGSGKTTTLYAALRQLDAHREKIISIEDPVEYEIDGITQIQVKPEIDLSFARVLRSVVRHDPNVIMVGETRDPETADIAVHAALTGHLLLTTLHTNSAAGAIARLLDMEIEPYLLASVLRGVVGQRLVGILCDACKEAYPASVDERHFFERAELPHGEDLVLHRPVGCHDCGETGFVGRIGIFELLEVTEPIRELIRGRAASHDIAAAAIRAGMRTMFQDGLLKVAAGTTTLEEVCRVTEDW